MKGAHSVNHLGAVNENYEIPPEGLETQNYPVSAEGTELKLSTLLVK